MSFVTIQRLGPTAPDGSQTRQEWVFTLMERVGRFTVYLERYTDSYRAPRKRKWDPVRSYYRLGEHYSSRQVLREEPDTPEDVVEEAIAQFRAQLTFQKWVRR